MKSIKCCFGVKLSMTKQNDKCSNCGSKEANIFFDYKDGSVLCEHCEKKYGSKWEKSHDKIFTTKQIIISITILIIIAIISFNIPSIWSANELNQGIELNDTGNYKEAIKHFNSALMLAQNNYEILTLKASALNNLGDYNGAIESVDKALSIKPNYSDALNNKAIALNGLNEYDEALFYYDKLLKLNPDYNQAKENKTQTLNNKILALNNLSLTAINSEKYDEAINYSNKVLEINPNDYNAKDNKLNALFNRGAELSDLEDYNKALYYFNSYLIINPNDLGTITWKINAQIMLEKFYDAIESADEALIIDPNNKVLLNNKAFALNSLGKHDESIENYDKALDIDPNFTDAKNNKAEAINDKGTDLVKAKAYQSAMLNFKNALELNPNLNLAKQNIENLKNMICSYSEVKINGFCVSCGDYGGPCCEREASCYDSSNNFWYTGGCVRGYCKKNAEESLPRVNPHIISTYYPSTYINPTPITPFVPYVFDNTCKTASCEIQRQLNIINNTPTTTTHCASNETLWGGRCYNNVTYNNLFK